MICKSFLAKSLLHCLHRRACAGVCTFVVADAACTKQVLLNTRACAAGVYDNKFVCDTGVLNTSIHMCGQVSPTLVYVFANTPSAGRAHALAYAQFVSLSLGDEGGGIELVYAGHLFAGVEGYFDMRKIGVLSVFSLFFDGCVGGKASGRDASGGGRREYYYRNSLEEDVSIITETASCF